MAEVTGRRERPREGFYRFLNSFSSADDYVEPSPKRRRLNCTSSDSGSDLPDGCYKVERLVSKRTKRVSILVKLSIGQMIDYSSHAVCCVQIICIMLVASTSHYTFRI